MLFHNRHRIEALPTFRDLPPAAQSIYLGAFTARGMKPPERDAPKPTGARPKRDAMVGEIARMRSIIARNKH